MAVIIPLTIQCIKTIKKLQVGFVTKAGLDLPTEKISMNHNFLNFHKEFRVFEIMGGLFLIHTYLYNVLSYVVGYSE